MTTTQTTFYDILEVSSSASPAVIRAAYKSLVQRHHPDRNGGSAEAEETLKRINLAFEVLSDPERRHLYDQAFASEREREQETPGATEPAPGRATPLAPQKAGGRMRKIVILAAVGVAGLFLATKWRAIASAVSWLFIIVGGLAALAGASNAFYSRKVDRRYKTGYKNNEPAMPFAQRLKGFGVMLAGLMALGIGLLVADANKSDGDQAKPAEVAQTPVRDPSIAATAATGDGPRGQNKASAAEAGANKREGAMEPSPLQGRAADNSGASGVNESGQQGINGRFSEGEGRQARGMQGASGLSAASPAGGEYLYKGRMPSGVSGTWRVRYMGNADEDYRVVIRSPEDDRTYYEAYCEAPCDFYRLDQYEEGALVLGSGLEMDRSVLPGQVLSDAVAGKLRISR